MKSNEKYNEAQVIVDLAKKEDRELTSEEDAQISACLEEGKHLQKREVMIAELEKRQAEMAESRGRVYQPEQDLDLPKDEKRGYSILRAVNCLMNHQPVDGLEGEISQEIAQRNGKDTSGFFLPMESRALDSTTGTGSVGTKYDPNMIDYLRNKSVVMRAGATVLPSIEGYGTLSIPKQTGTASTYYLSESADTTASNQTIGSVTMTPNTLSAMTEISRRFLKTGALDAEQFVRNDLASVIGLAIDYAALRGDGSTQGNITGILNNSSVNTVTVGDGTNGAYVDITDLYNLEKEIAVDNADDLGAMRFCLGPKLRAQLKGRDVASVDGTTSNVTGQFIYQNDTVIGYPAICSTQLPEALTVGTATCAAAVLGSFNQMMIGFWGQSAAEILIDPYSLSKSGGVRIVAMVDYDVEVRNAVAWAKIVDAKL